ncbi:MAG TPA: translation initiation factor IF-3 [Candidatus Sulfotelmatobacter sp.]|nr:translation initiation factor IF-3 [Candidatus Sulfotelmatobacter sp.]
MSRPFPPRTSPSSGAFVRVNGKIRAREVRVIGVDGKQLGVLTLGDALTLARSHQVDLVEIAPNATPPVCRLVDFGKYRYEQAKRDKESKKHQHANKVKEVQLSPKIDPHDLSVKIGHAIDFLCEDMKIKITLKFRGREMAHTEFGFQVVEKFLADVAPYGHPDFQPKLNGRAINLMISPLPRNKRAKHPQHPEEGAVAAPAEAPTPPETRQPATVQVERAPRAEEPRTGGFANNPFAQLEVNR